MSNYRNNEDIVLTGKRISPEVQKMGDPNKEKAKYTYKNGKWSKGRHTSISMMQATVQHAMREATDSFSEKQKQKKFMEEYLNSCDRCGMDISSYKALHPKQYHMGLCKRCNSILEENHTIRIR